MDYYKFHVKQLCVAGGDNDNSSKGTGDPVKTMDYYIPSTGPEKDTPDFAINLWSMIS